MTKSGSTMANTRLRSNIYIQPGLGIFQGYVGDNREHKHCAHQLNLAVFADVEIYSQDFFFSASSLFIHANTPHRAPPQHLFSLFLDPTSLLARALVARLEGPGPIHPLPDTLETLLRQTLLHAKSFDQGLSDLESTLKIRDLPASDSRLSSVLETLHQRTAAQEFVTCAELAEQAGISASRFSHWFKEATHGLTLRRYRKWLRLLCGIERAMNGQPLTEAAHEVAFSDQAHFTRCFVEMFGVTPSSILKNR